MSWIVSLSIGAGIGRSIPCDVPHTAPVRYLTRRIGSHLYDPLRTGSDGLRSNMPDVRRWLLSSGFGQYAEAFEKNAIGWDVLAHLNYDILRDVGVGTAGDRIRILHAIKSLRARDE